MGMGGRVVGDEGGGGGDGGGFAEEDEVVLFIGRGDGDGRVMRRKNSWG